MILPRFSYLHSYQSKTEYFRNLDDATSRVSKNWQYKYFLNINESCLKTPGGIKQRKITHFMETKTKCQSKYRKNSAPAGSTRYRKRRL